MERITLLLAAGDPSLLRGLRMRLEIEPGFAVVGEARALDEIERQAEALAPQVVVIDADAPAGSAAAIELLSTVAAAHRVVVVSLDERAGTRAAVLEAGAAAFVPKHDGSGALISAIRRVARDDGREAR
jgi:DNA-binding NarL/FixJ family response regulator